MTKLTKTEISPYSPKQIYDLIKDVESYPQFLPWIANAYITHKINEHEFEAKLTVKFKIFTESYISHVTLIEPSTADNSLSSHIADGNYKIISKLVTGPFDYLHNIWTLSPYDNDSTKISLELEFKFHNSTLEKILGGIFGKASAKMVDSFRQRAKTLYG